MSSMIAFAPSNRRSRWRSRKAGWPARTRSPSQTPSPSTKPESKTDTTARSRGTSSPLTQMRIRSLRASSSKSWVPWAIVQALAPRRAVDQRQVLVDHPDRHRPLAHGRRDALDRPRAHVARCEDAGPARLERERRALAPVGRGVEMRELEVLAREHEAVVIDGERVVEPGGARIGADEDEDRVRIDRSRSAVALD